jgi:hypothetical protein
MSIGSMITQASQGVWGLRSASTSLLRQPPEPRSSTGAWGAVATAAMSGVGSAVGSTISALGGGAGDFGALLTMQIEVQRQMAVVSMLSNVEKSKHETEMAPIRNLRVG